MPKGGIVGKEWSPWEKEYRPETWPQGPNLPPTADRPGRIVLPPENGLNPYKYTWTDPGPAWEFDKDGKPTDLYGEVLLKWEIKSGKGCKCPNAKIQKAGKLTYERKQGKMVEMTWSKHE